MWFLPLNNLEMPPRVPPDDAPEREAPELDTLVPDDPQNLRHARRVRAVLDDGEFFEIQAGFAPNIISGFSRMALSDRRRGQPAGAPRRDDRHRVIEKAARFVRTCDAFNVPLVAFEDVPGFFPGTYQEQEGIIRHGANSFTRSPRRRCPASPSSRARRTAEPMR